MSERDQPWRRKRLSEAAEHVGSKAELGRKLGFKSGAFVQQMINGDRPITEKTMDAVDALPGLKDWFKRQPVKTDTRSSGWLVAHDLIPGATKIAPQAIEWEQLVTVKDLGDLFATALPDDALAPDNPQGLNVIWSTTKRPVIGSLVIVRDAHGALHARKYAQGRSPGQWVAWAPNQAFASFDSADGLTIVAVAAFRELP